MPSNIDRWIYSYKGNTFKITFHVNVVILINGEDIINERPVLLLQERLLHINCWIKCYSCLNYWADYIKVNIGQREQNHWHEKEVRSRHGGGNEVIEANQWTPGISNYAPPLCKPSWRQFPLPSDVILFTGRWKMAVLFLSACIFLPSKCKTVFIVKHLHVLGLGPIYLLTVFALKSAPTSFFEAFRNLRSWSCRQHKVTTSRNSSRSFPSLVYAKEYRRYIEPFKLFSILLSAIRTQS